VEKQLADREAELEGVKNNNLKLLLEVGQLKERLAALEEERRTLKESLKEARNGFSVAKQNVIFVPSCVFVFLYLFCALFFYF